MGLASGAGAHMMELRRTRSGAFGERACTHSTMCRMPQLRHASGDPAALDAMILSVDAAVPELPTVIIRDYCDRCDLPWGSTCRSRRDQHVPEFNKGQTVAVLSQKKEFVCLGQSARPSASFKPGDTGLIVAPTTVFMPPGTYPRGWTKSDKVFPEKKKPGRKPGEEPAGRQEARREKTLWQTGIPIGIRVPEQGIPLKKYPAYNRIHFLLR